MQGITDAEEVRVEMRSDEKTRLSGRVRVCMRLASAGDGI